MCCDPCYATTVINNLLEHHALMQSIFVYKLLQMLHSLQENVLRLHVTACPAPKGEQVDTDE